MAETQNTDSVKLTGLFATKIGMSAVYNENGEYVPVTVLKYEPMVVSQLKTKEKDGYAAVQVAARPKRPGLSTKAASGHLKGAGFENGAHMVRELRGEIPEGLTVGTRISLDTLAKGDTVKITATSKGKGFAGVLKRWNFQGGPATHGSHFHRQPGSSGNRTWPGRIMPGKKFPGHLGDETVTVKSVKIVDVRAEEGVILVKGPVPGSRNTLVKLVKEQ
jgi:large subunit ribosomal protein L3